MMATKQPNPTDKHVGAKVRQRRLMMGISQEKLGDALGLTFQQVQKYEKGTNRIGASRLSHIASVLQVAPGWFFPDQPAGSKSTSTQQVDDYTAGFLNTTEGLALCKSFTQIESDKLRRSIVLMVQQIAATHVD